MHVDQVRYAQYQSHRVIKADNILKFKLLNYFCLLTQGILEVHIQIYNSLMYERISLF